MIEDNRVVEFGNKVREVRRKKGISQEKLAGIADINRSYMGNIERGEKNISLAKAYQIADALEVGLHELV